MIRIQIESETSLTSSRRFSTSHTSGSSTGWFQMVTLG